MENLKELIKQKYEVQIGKVRCILLGRAFINVFNGTHVSSLDEYNRNLEYIGEKLGEYDILEIYNLDYNIIWTREELVDWSSIDVDTPVWVRDNQYDEWLPRHFAKYEDGMVYVWDMGCTSFSVLQYGSIEDEDNYIEFRQARLDKNKRFNKR